MQSNKTDIGYRYSKLVVLDIAPNQGKKGSYFICKCDCGSITTVRGSNLRSGNTQSCACIKKLNTENRINSEIGKRYGKLTVVRREPNSKRGAYFTCICDCGKEVVVCRADLRAKNTKSCGCSRVRKSNR